MENLQTRLDRVENEELDLIEKDSKDIKDQIKYWDLVKQTNLIFYAARKAGIHRLGLKTVPALQVSERKAKDAIEMSLTLTSLAQSRFGNEHWTLRNTSRELFESPPAFCFKKDGSNVKVKWDGDDDNVTEYTAWQFIYCQNEDGTWDKSKGKLDYKGLYYDDNHIRFYYLEFSKEAAKYSKTNTWEVSYKNMIVTPVTAPVFTSTRSGQQTQQQGQKRPASPTQEEASPSKRTRGGRRGRHHQLVSPSGGHQHQTRSQAGPSSSLRLDRRGGSRSRVRERRRGEPGATGLNPGEVGSVHQTPEGKHLSRIGRLLEEARDPPVIVCAGAPNILKCYRYRVIRKYSGHFQDITTNFKWAGGGGKGQGSSRMLIAFESIAQRKAFENFARFPPSIQHFHGNLAKL